VVPERTSSKGVGHNEATAINQPLRFICDSFLAVAQAGFVCSGRERVYDDKSTAGLPVFTIEYRRRAILTSRHKDAGENDGDPRIIVGMWLTE
jgi:hypothetical protein